MNSILETSTDIPTSRDKQRSAKNTLFTKIKINGQHKHGLYCVRAIQTWLMLYTDNTAFVFPFCTSSTNLFLGIKFSCNTIINKKIAHP